jgi:hypothetical protein
MERYVRALLDGARQALRVGTTSEAFASTPPPPPFDTWKFSPFYEANARFVYDWLARGAGPERP